MNHSKLFWAVRNEFSAEMKVLWENGYTGGMFVVKIAYATLTFISCRVPPLLSNSNFTYLKFSDGLWGRGLLLENGKFSHEELGEDEVMPDHMCGGGFKSRGRKRKIKPKVTYKERQERRIKKRFGTNGITLGADGKANLEKGKRPPGKPRVAGSARGRELRAAAALSRFETKKEPEHKEEDLMTDSESASDLHHDDDDDALVKTEFPDAVDINGDKLLDSNGQSYVKVCDDEDRNDEDVREELLDLLGISGSSVSRQADLKRAIEPELESQKTKNSKSAATNHSQTSSESNAAARQGLEELKPAREKRMFTNSTEREVDGAASERSCPVCSMLNEATSLTCNVCSNVLQPDFVPNSWRCGSLVCKDSAFVNAGDVVLCGVCRTRK